MARLLPTRRLKCFYCGSGTALRSNAAIRQFDCDRCLATNFLDENGEITDPPVAIAESSASAPVRYARPQSLSPSPPSDDVFCDNCLKNQHLYKENIALYLPESHDPRYKEYLASLPAYKAKLEERYPQVCADCAPRARERIRQAGYVAKTDHLRRMMSGTRDGRVPLRAGTWWRLWIIRLGGLGWWTSTMVQVCWHLAGAIARNPQDSVLDLSIRTDSWIAAATTCTRQVTRRFEADTTCITSISSFIPILVLVSLLTIWWNPCLSDKYLRQRRGKMKGLADYFVHCIVLLLFRITGWWLLKEPQAFQFDNEIYKASHIFMVVFIIFTLTYGLTLVRLEKNPAITFHVPCNEILPDVPERNPNAPARAPSLRIAQAPVLQPAMHTLQTRQQTQNVVAASHGPTRSIAQQRTSFQPSVSNTNPQQHSSAKGLFASHTSSRQQNDAYDPDAMDWSPSQSTNVVAANDFRPRAAKQSAIPNGPSPFQSRIPAAPPNRMRHPKEAATVSGVKPFQRATEAQKQNFFSGITNRRQEKQGNLVHWDETDTSAVTTKAELEDDDDDIIATNLSQKKATSGRASEFSLGPQRLFLKSDDRDTGLESMFDEVFSFREEPSVIERPESARVNRVEISDEGRGPNVFGLPSGSQAVDHQALAPQTSGSIQQSLLSVVLVGLLPAIILGGVAVGVKLWNAKSVDSIHEL